MIEQPEERDDRDDLNTRVLHTVQAVPTGTRVFIVTLNAMFVPKRAVRLPNLVVKPWRGKCSRC
jgi:hypothetical protein